MAGSEEKFEYKIKMVDKVAQGDKRGESVRSAIWDSNGCVSMWWYMYIEGYIFEILRIRGLSMSRFDLHSLRNQNKKSIERRSRLLKQIIF